MQVALYCLYHARTLELNFVHRFLLINYKLWIAYYQRSTSLVYASDGTYIKISLYLGVFHAC